MSAADGYGAAYVVEVLDQPDGTTRRRVRARTVSMARLSKRELARGELAYPPSIQAEHQRPVTRGDCLPGGCNGARPCPWVSCTHHLYLDVNDRTGSIKLNFPDLEAWDLPETCGLDIADRGGLTLEEVADVMNLTRERIRQLEQRALLKIRARQDAASLEDYAVEEPAHHNVATGTDLLAWDPSRGGVP